MLCKTIQALTFCPDFVEAKSISFVMMQLLLFVIFDSTLHCLFSSLTFFPNPSTNRVVSTAPGSIFSMLRTAAGCIPISLFAWWRLWNSPILFKNTSLRITHAPLLRFCSASFTSFSESISRPDALDQRRSSVYQFCRLVLCALLGPSITYFVWANSGCLLRSLQDSA